MNWRSETTRGEKAQTLLGRCDKLRKRLAEACALAGTIIGAPLDMEAEERAEPTSAIERVEQRLEDCRKATKMLTSQLARIQQSIGF